MVQVLTDLNLIIRRAYISSDGEWFMDGNKLFSMPVFLSFISISVMLLCFFFLVFHVTDQHGKKLCDDSVGERIQQVHLKTQILVLKLPLNLIELMQYHAG